MRTVGDATFPLTVEAALFDLDGVLVDSTVCIEAHWRAFAGWYGLDATAVLAAVHGVRARDVIEREVGHLGGVEVATARRRHEELELADVAGTVTMPGAVDLLTAIGARPWAVVTAGTAGVATARMRAAGLPEPTHVVGADNVIAGKPDPEGYCLAASWLGVDVLRCVVLEDAPVGIEAGRAAGATVIALTTTHTADQVRSADLVVSDLGAVTVRLGGHRLVFDRRVG